MVMVMVMDTAMDTMDTMARERLMLSLDTTIMAIVMVTGMAMDMAMVMDTMDNFSTKYLCCAESSVRMN